MSLFGKKPEPPPFTQSRVVDDDRSPSNRAYGVADLIRLLKTIPVDQHPDLVVRVVKTTLESVGVQSAHVVDDALRQEAAINERISVLEAEIVELSGEIQLRRDQIAQLQMELAETTYAKDRLLGADGITLPAPVSASQSDPVGHESKPRSLPPPLPPPRHRPSGKPPEPATGT